jgi:glycosyltransferase involved in cell wall biosynthesis
MYNIGNMKLFYDARYIRTDFHDGISRYSTELGNAVAKLTDVTFIIHDKQQLKYLPKNAKYVQIHGPTSPKDPLTARVLNQYNPDVVFSPMQTMGSAGRKFKLILTSHDLIYYHYRKPPTYLNPAIRLGWYAYHLTYTPQRLQLNGADMVATVSHTSLREFEQAKLTKRPIIVIPNAPQDLSKYAQPPKTSKAPRDLIYMGSFMPYKNVETLIKGMKWLPGYTLHLLSKITDKRKDELTALIPKKASVVFHGGVSDEEYAKLLAKGALVSASHYEGFGLPLAEALGLGVPAVVTDMPIFHEVAAGGALYFNPHDPKMFAEQVLKLDDSATRKRLIASGKTHIQTFSWEASAQALVNAAKSLL